MGWVLLGAVVLVILYPVVVYGRLVSLQQQMIRAFADIDAQLKQRRDLVPALVESMKHYAAHERRTLDAVMAARDAAATAHGPTHQVAAESQLTGALGHLFALSESYPNLKASEPFLVLQERMAAVEDDLAAARKLFNSTVSEFNAAIRSFPAVLFAGSLGFIPREFFDIGEGQRSALDVPPRVEF
ncbi:LemA family protein [Microvirga massiliensis]|uniref:LemA family protein n=1 Tax=Microvirga massiliensis TaxID=1033741 RepID=UPI00062BD692|nr:LemA family protein [Microvirga massiliensis]